MVEETSASEHLHTRCDVAVQAMDDCRQTSLSNFLNKVAFVQGQRDMDLIACSVQFAFDPTLIALTL